MERADHQGDAALEAYAVGMEQEYEEGLVYLQPFADANICEHCLRDTRSMAVGSQVCPNCALRLCSDCFPLTMHAPCQDIYGADSNGHGGSNDSHGRDDNDDGTRDDELSKRRECSSAEVTSTSVEPGYIRQPHSGTASTLEWAQYRQKDKRHVEPYGTGSPLAERN